MGRSLEILNVLKEIFWKTKTFCKNLLLRLKTQHFHTKVPCQKSMLRQVQWEVQNGPITKNEVLSVTTLFFWKFCFGLRTSYKELKVHIHVHYSKVHIHTFRKRWSFIWGCFFFMNILQVQFFVQQKVSEIIQGSLDFQTSCCNLKSEV